jgi:tetratricopeptide (TPR) repeat protein
MNSEEKQRQAEEYFDQGDYNRATEMFHKTTELDPDNAAAFYNLGLVYSTQGDYVRAIESYHKAIELKLDDADADAYTCAYNNLGHAYYNRAKAYHDQGDYAGAKELYQKAKESFEKAKELMPDDT